MKTTTDFDFRQLAELRRQQLEAAMQGDVLRSAQYADEARRLRYASDRSTPGQGPMDTHPHHSIRLYPVELASY